MSNKKFTLTIELLSDTLIGSGQGFGVLIDSDVVFDQFSIPYIPAKRVKGLLRDSACEILDTALGSGYNVNTLDTLFGKKGSNGSEADSHFHDLHIANHEKIHPWLNYLMSKYTIFTTDAVKNCYTSTRSQTAIENGTAKKNSLRTVRVLNKALCFRGEVSISCDAPADLLKYAAHNLKWLGTKRNRGFGNVRCTLTEMEAENV